MIPKNYFFTEPSVQKGAMLDSQLYYLNLGGELSMFICKMMFKLPKKPECTIVHSVNSARLTLHIFLEIGRIMPTVLFSFYFVLCTLYIGTLVRESNDLHRLSSIFTVKTFKLKRLSAISAS